MYIVGKVSFYIIRVATIFEFYKKKSTFYHLGIVSFFDQNSYQNVTHIIVISLEILYPSWFFKKNSDQKMQKSRFLEKL